MSGSNSEKWLKSVYIYGSYCKNKIGVPFFWTTLYGSTLGGDCVVCPGDRRLYVPVWAYRQPILYTCFLTWSTFYAQLSLPVQNRLHKPQMNNYLARVNATQRRVFHVTRTAQVSISSSVIHITPSRIAPSHFSINSQSHLLAAFLLPGSMKK